VRTISNTGQTTTEALSGWEIETPERVVHVTRIEARVRRGDLMRLAPQCLTVEDPGSLVH
jgi:hypothetical protein